MRPIEPTPSGTIASDLVGAPTSPSSPRFPELDGRRGLAALGVAVIHLLTGPLASYAEPARLVAKASLFVFLGNVRRLGTGCSSGLDG